jgi:hypothetical protein
MQPGRTDLIRHVRKKISLVASTIHVKQRFSAAEMICVLIGQNV